MADVESPDSFLVERVDRVVVIRIARPPVNALRYRDWEYLGTLLNELEADESVGAAVITGRPGSHFSAGNDVKELSKLGADARQAGAGTVRATLASA